MAEITPIIGRIISRYRILEEVGRGGMATVYRALDTTLAREVAVKVLHPHLAGEAESRSRLEREAQAVAKLRHDNILEIHDYSGSASETAESYIVTEFIRGPTLTAFLGKYKVSVPEVAAMIVHELAAALETAHRHGVIHRDIKPENVMIRTEDGRVKLTDFGIAQIIDKERLTATGQLIGSPAYLAPELVEGGRVDFRTDVFSLGIVLYRVATGQLPFQGRNPHEMMKRIVECKYTPPDQVNPAVGRGLQKTIARALSRRPDDRHPDMETLRRELAADLAIAGIDDVRAELGRYFTDPDGWEKAARPRLTAALVASARKEKSRSTALALVGRALALSPGDAAAKAVLDRMGRTRRRGSAAMVVASSVAIVAAGAWMVRYRAAHPRVVAPTIALSAPSAPGATTAPGPRLAAPRPQPASAITVAALDTGESRNRQPGSRPSRPPPAASAGRDVTINVLPHNVEVLVDGVQRPWLTPAKLHVTPGPHRLLFRNPSFFPMPYELPAGATATSSLQLEWLPANLKVVTEPKGASIEIEQDRGVSASMRDGEPRIIPIRQIAPADGYKMVKVTVSAAGYATAERTVRVRGGETHEESFTLRKH